MVFSTIEITFVGFAVILLLLLFLLLVRGGFFSLPQEHKRDRTKETEKVENRQGRRNLQERPKKAQTTGDKPKQAEKKKPAVAAKPKAKVQKPQKKEEIVYETILNLGYEEKKDKKPKAAAKPKAKPVIKTEKPVAITPTVQAPAASRPERNQRKPQNVKFSNEAKPEQTKNHESAEAGTSRAENNEHREPKEPQRIICYNCGHLGHTSKDCPVKKLTTICFSCGELGHTSVVCPEKNNVNKLTCYKCGEHGHVSKDCPLRKAQAEDQHVDLNQQIQDETETD